MLQPSPTRALVTVFQKFRTLLSMRSRDFGLTPDRGIDPNSNAGCDPGLKRQF